MHNFGTPALAVHNTHRTLPAPEPHPPTLRRMCHLRSPDLQPRSPLWPPALIHRGALHAATTDGDRPRHASGAAHNQGTKSRSRQPGGALLRKRCAIASGQRWTAALTDTRCRVAPAVAFQFTTDRTRRPLQAARNYPQGAAQLKAQLDQRVLHSSSVCTSFPWQHIISR